MIANSSVIAVVRTDEPVDPIRERLDARGRAQQATRIGRIT